MKTFPTLDIASAYTGTCLNPDDIMGFHAVLDHVLGDTLMTHQLPAASRAADVALAAQFPWLADLEPPRGDLDALARFNERLVSTYGPTLDVRSAAEVEVGAEWVGHNGLADLLAIAEGRRVIGVVVDGGDPDA